MQIAALCQNILEKSVSEYCSIFQTHYTFPDTFNQNCSFSIVMISYNEDRVISVREGKVSDKVHSQSFKWKSI